MFIITIWCPIPFKVNGKEVSNGEVVKCDSLKDCLNISEQAHMNGASVQIIGEGVNLTSSLEVYDEAGRPVNGSGLEWK